MAGDDGLYLDLVSMLESGDDLDRVENRLRRLHDQEPESQRVVILHATLQERRGQYQAARQTLEALIARSSDNAVARTNLARLQWQAGERSQAISTLRFGLMQAPNQERALHFYAALLEEDSGISGALAALKMLAQMPGAWLPAWVGAQLAVSRAPDQAGELLVLAARQARVPFPPNPESFARLLESMPDSHKRHVAMSLRPYCRSEAQAFIDAILARPIAPQALSAAVASSVRRSVWRHLSHPQSVSSLGIAPVVLINPQSWGVAEVAGRLSRGFALLLAEGLDAAASFPACVLLESVPEAGVVTRSSLSTGADLAALANDSCQHLISSYLSFKLPDEFILDAEIYSNQGVYLARESCRASHPGDCLRQMIAKVATAFATPTTTPHPPQPNFDIEDALARETVASFLLCAEGSLDLGTLRNPGQSLDALVDYALQAESAAGLLVLWAGIEAAARAGLAGGEAQRAVVEEIISQNEGLRFWIDVPSSRS